MFYLQIAFIHLNDFNLTYQSDDVKVSTIQPIADKTMRQKTIDLGKLLGEHIKLPKWLLNLGERYLGFRHLNIANANINADLESGLKGNFFELACTHLNLRYELNEGGLEHIPKEGACVIVCNHPHGFSDGIMFGEIAMKVRSDVRIVVNEFLNCVHGIRPHIFQVDVLGGNKSRRANLVSIRNMLQWLREGHCVLVFPSGSVATYSRKDRRIIDDPWQKNIASIIRKTEATVVPMHISGRSGLFFQAISLLCKGKRAAILSREVKRDGRMLHKITLGRPIPPSIITSFEDDNKLSDYLRLRSTLLNYKTPAKFLSPPLEEKEKEKEPIAQRIDPELLINEIANIPQEYIYYQSERTSLTVYAVTAKLIPNLMQEIAILREITFREVGEGTGKSFDLDEFDEYYTHLIMWDNNKQRLAGSYRMGLCDKILKEKGMKGIYTFRFFNFNDTIRDTMMQSIEMGRAFIGAEYQKLPTSLDTLWMSIGNYMQRHKQYKYLFGTVSISASYSWLSRSLITSYLKCKVMNQELSSCVHAINPADGYALRSEDERLISSALADTKILSKLVRDIEKGAQGLPILLKHYLRLDGKMLAFNLDMNFGDTLDCLVLVDMYGMPQRLFKRYMNARPYVIDALKN